jgi:ATP/maltotriose-dependent transcriptional regulator MalT
LFAEFLRRRLRASDPGQERELHRRAARWLAHQRLFPEAIAHALQAEDFTQAGEWIEYACDAAMQHGQLATIRQWLGALPPKVVANSPGLNIWYGWALALQNEFEAMETHLEQAEKQARRLARAQRFWKTEVRMVRGKIAAIRTHAAMIQQEDAKTLYWTRRTLALLPERYLRERGVAWMSRARAFEHLKRFDEADEAYLQAERTTHKADHPFLYLGVLEAHARFLLERGEMERARSVLKQAVEFAHARHVEGLAASMKTMLQEIVPPFVKRTREPLSGREREIVDWLARGESNPQIAERLGIGVGTVNWHTKNIYKKLGARNRTEAAALARAL